MEVIRCIYENNLTYKYLYNSARCEVMKKIGGEDKLFFKYRSLDNKKDFEKIKDSLTNNKLVFSSPNNFNDPFDSAFRVQNKGTKEEWEEYLFWLDLDEEDVRYVLTEELKKIDEHVYIYSKKVPSPSKDYNKIIRESIHILSLSQISDNILMWSHYASNHKGICLCFKAELDDEKLGFYFDSEFLLLSEVKYQKKFPNSINMLKINAISFFDFLTIKYIDWKYEKEWRIFVQNTEENIKSFKQYKKDSLEGIIFGLYTPTDYIKEIYKIVKKNYLDEGYNINFYKCIWIEGKYLIKPERIESIEIFLDSEREVVQYLL